MSESFPINHSASREIPDLFWTLKIDYCVHKIPPLMRIPSQAQLVRIVAHFRFYVSGIQQYKLICSASLYSRPRSRNMWRYTKRRKNKSHISSINNIQRVASWYICLAALEFRPSVVCRCIHMACDNISIQPICSDEVCFIMSLPSDFL